jgi:hypothetical protein
MFKMALNFFSRLAGALAPARNWARWKALPSPHGREARKKSARTEGASPPVTPISSPAFPPKSHNLSSLSHSIRRSPPPSTPSQVTAADSLAGRRRHQGPSRQGRSTAAAKTPEAPNPRPFHPFGWSVLRGQAAPPAELICAPLLL